MQERVIIAYISVRPRELERRLIVVWNRALKWQREKGNQEKSNA